MKKLITLLTATWLSTAAFAQDALPKADGEVRRVDARAQTVTLKHGEIKNLDMPPMTMAFKVQDPALLSQVKAGDKVRFTADKLGGNYTVLSLEPLPAGAPAGAPAPAATEHKH
ncbi:MAG: copper-binding protein [Hydrogenophaga sp.]|nr:copper-binding protein [Hydrogenophaga sp.]